MSASSSEIVLSVKNLHKKFARSEEGARRILAGQLSDAMFSRTPPVKKNHAGEFWALRDISFDLHRGEVLGVIGFNGAGKSTLLRVLAGLMLPDGGEVRAYGSTGALLELGAGMKPSLSGKRNIFVKGALLGKTPAEMEALYEEIAEFSELGEFLNAPLKTYSSGMRLRLGFSVAAFMRPDILLLDEILAVGDYAFKQKCRGKINEMLESAGVVFVTHSMNDVRQICDKAIVLDRGGVVFKGKPRKAIEAYFALGEQKIGGLANSGAPELNFFGELYNNEDRISDVVHEWRGENGKTDALFDTWGPAECHIRFQLKKKPRRLVIGVTIWTDDGFKVTGLATDMCPENIFDHDRLTHHVVMALPKLSLNPGTYVSTVAIVDNGEAVYRGRFDNFTVTSSQRNHGVCTPPHQWCTIYETPDAEPDGAAKSDKQDEKTA